VFGPLEANKEVVSIPIAIPFSSTAADPFKSNPSSSHARHILPLAYHNPLTYGILDSGYVGSAESVVLCQH
jgi:hypothetical protein